MKKYSIMILIVAAVLLEGVAAVQYFMARHGAEQYLMAKAERDLEESRRVAEVKARVESAVKNILPAVQARVEHPEGFSSLIARMVKDNEDIVGAGVAFPRDFYKDGGRKGLYAPYAYDTNPALTTKDKKNHQPNVHADLLGFDYTDREWFQKPLADGSSLWTEPYVDKGGTHILMVTYTAPVVVNGRRVAVLFADVPLNDVSILSQEMYSGIQSSGIIVILMHVVILLVLGFIIWKAISASRRYKEQYVDAEKERLIEQLQKLKEVNARLTNRNKEMAEKVADLQRRIQAGSQQSDQHWFG